MSRVDLVRRYTNTSKTDALKVLNFIDVWFDDLRWSEATLTEIRKAVREAQKMMNDPQFAEMVELSNKVGA